MASLLDGAVAGWWYPAVVVLLGIITAGAAARTGDTVPGGYKFASLAGLLLLLVPVCGELMTGSGVRLGVAWQIAALLNVLVLVTTTVTAYVHRGEGVR